MIFHINKSTLRLHFICITCVLSSCNMFWSPHSPHGYTMPRPEKMILEKKVDEISGISSLGNGEGFLAIADDKQKVFRLTTTGTVNDYFGQNIGEGAADYEDVVALDSSVFVLVSNGTLKEVKRAGNDLFVQVYAPPAAGKNDFETLYYDATAPGLIMLCKKCASDKGKKQRTAYRFDVVTRKWDAAPFFTISSKEVNQSLKDGEIDLDPSGAAIHPLQKKLYILSSAGNLLVVATLRGKVLEAYRLNPTLYPQAEGIAFEKNGDMYITNEAKLGKPTLLKLVYQPDKK